MTEVPRPDSIHPLPRQRKSTHPGKLLSQKKIVPPESRNKSLILAGEAMWQSSGEANILTLLVVLWQQELLGCQAMPKPRVPLKCHKCQGHLLHLCRARWMNAMTSHIAALSLCQSLLLLTPDKRLVR